LTIPIAALPIARDFSTGTNMELVLASTSPIRGTLLANAGVPYGVQAPGVDEAEVKAGFHGDDGALATRLAEAKALAVSAKRPGALVIGSDSLVSVEGRRFDKPGGRETAAEHLRFFSGKVMQLTSAVVLAQGSEIVWRHASEARLHVRTLSENFIADYLEDEWPEVSYCVGVFRLEGPGVQLFDRIEGDHFTILGLPLLPLLGALRERGYLTA
jgi:septum formation protein